MFRREYTQALNAYKSRLAWADRSLSDSIAYLNAYRMYKTFASGDFFKQHHEYAEKWCVQNFIQYKRILEVDNLIQEFTNRLSYVNIRVPERPNLYRYSHEEQLILKVMFDN